MVASLRRTTSDISLNNGSRGGGPLGTVSSFLAALEQEGMIYSTHGFEFAYKEEEYQNNQRIVAAGGEALPTLKSIGGGVGLEDYTSFIREVYGTDDVPMLGADARRTRAINKSGLDLQYKNLKERYPDAGILDTEELLSAVYQRGQQAQKRASRISGFVPGVAEFAAGTVRAFDPVVNPAFALNLLPTGFARTTIARIATEAGLGMATAAIDEFTGVRENMRYFGVEPTTMGTVTNIAFGAAAPIAFNAALRGLRAGVRRVLPKPATPPPPAPPGGILGPPEAVPGGEAVAPPIREFEPLSSGEREVLERFSPSYAKRAAGVIDEADKMHNTWASQPENMSPEPVPVGSSVNVRPYRPGSGDLKPSAVTKLGVDGFATLGDAARALDRTTFETLDDLRRQLAEAQEQLKTNRAINEQKKLGVTTTLEAEIKRAQAALAGAKPKDKGLAAAKLQELVERREPVPTTIRASEPLDELGVHKRILNLMTKINEHMPAVELALARAQRTYRISPQQKDALWANVAKLVSPNQKVGGILDNVPDSAPASTAQSKTRGVPEAKDAGPNDLLTDVANRNTKQANAGLAKRADDTRTQVSKVLSNIDRLEKAKAAGEDTTELEKGMDFRVSGTNVDIRKILDVPVERDGTTLRKLLEDVDDDSTVLNIIGVCAVG